MSQLRVMHRCWQRSWLRSVPLPKWWNEPPKQALHLTAAPSGPCLGCRLSGGRRQVNSAFGRGRMAEGRGMAPGRPSLGELVVKTIVAHTVTYFLVGLAAFWCFDYTRKF